MTVDLDPVLRRWLVSEIGDEALAIFGQPLAALTIAGKARNGDVPDEVLSRWRGEIATMRRVIDQSELALIERLRRAEHSWEAIGAVLGLGGAADTTKRRDTLVDRLRSTHPGNAAGRGGR